MFYAWLFLLQRSAVRYLHYYQQISEVIEDKPRSSEDYALNLNIKKQQKERFEMSIEIKLTVYAQST